MVAALVIATVLDLGLALLLIGVSGFVLQGVNNTGPMMPEAILFILMIVISIASPLAAWAFRRDLGSATLLALAYAPPVIAVGVLLAEPLFV